MWWDYEDMPKKGGSPNGRSLFGLAEQLLETLHQVDRKSKLSMALGVLASVGHVKGYITAQDTLEKRLKKMGLTETHTTIRDFTYLTLKRIADPPDKPYANKDDDVELRRFNLDGCEVYFRVEQGGVRVTAGAYVHDVDEFKTKFRDFFWRAFDGNDVVLNVRRKGYDSWVEPHELPNERGIVIGDVDREAVEAKLKPFLDRGQGCTLLISGPPGTGKTTLARHIAGGLGHTLLVTPEAMEEISAPSFVEVVDLLDPEVLLLDDFDRVSSWWVKRFLAEIGVLNERMRNTARLMIATVNDLDSLDVAMKRPGRFDMLVIIKRPKVREIEGILCHYLIEMDVEHTKKEVKKAARKAKGLSGAYIRLLAECLSIYGMENANREVREVRAQAKACGDLEEPEKKKKEGDTPEDEPKKISSAM